MLTVDEMASLLNVDQTTISIWRRNGLLNSYATTARGDYLYEHPGDNPPQKYAWQRAVSRK